MCPRGAGWGDGSRRGQLAMVGVDSFCFVPSCPRRSVHDVYSGGHGCPFRRRRSHLTKGVLVFFSCAETSSIKIRSFRVIVHELVSSLIIPLLAVICVRYQVSNVETIPLKVCCPQCQPTGGRQERCSMVHDRRRANIGS